VDNNPKLEEARRQAVELQQQLAQLRAEGRDPAAEAKLEQELLAVNQLVVTLGAGAPAPDQVYAQPPVSQQPYGQPAAGPYGQPMLGQGPYGPQGLQESRATMILVFGILSIVVCQLFGPFAWSMGSEDLRKMDQGLMNPRERGSVVAGRICGIIGTALMAIWVLVVGIMILGAATAVSHY
jgi:hypothetical protein